MLLRKNTKIGDQKCLKALHWPGYRSVRMSNGEFPITPASGVGRSGGGREDLEICCKWNLEIKIGHQEFA